MRDFREAKYQGTQAPQTWVGSTGYVTIDNLPNISEPQCPHLVNGDSTFFVEWYDGDNIFRE